MKNKFWFKFALWRQYFDQGYSLLSYPKYPLFIIGMGDVISNDGDFTNIIIGGLIFAVFCFVSGWILYHKGYVAMSWEVQNQVNPFVKEMRKVFK